MIKRLSINSILVVLFIMFEIIPVCAQSTSAVEFHSLATDDAIFLRWQYKNFRLQKACQKNGVLLTKIWNRDNKQLFKRDTIYPIIYDGLDYANIDDVYNKVAIQVLEQQYLKTAEQYDLIKKLELEKEMQLASAVAAAASPIAARTLALGFTDKDIRNGESIFYSIKILGIDSLSTQFVTRLNVDDRITRSTIEVDNYSAVDKLVSITWNFKQYEDDYFAFLLEKSTDNGLTYYPTSETIFFPLTTENPNTESELATIQDSVAENNKEYYYRLIGVDIFGQLGPPSEVLKITSLPPPLPVTPEINSVFELDNRQFQIDWHLQQKYENQSKYFQVTRSDESDGYYSVISPNIPINQRSFIDENPDDVNFYRIELIDENNYVLTSVAVLGQLNDKYPPSKPTGLTGKVDTTGEVRLSWDKNIEGDLEGYHVFYGNTKLGEYSLLTSGGEVDSAYYVDSIYVKTLGEKVYYKIMAIDFRGNQSEYSDVLVLDRPDIYPPTQGVFKQFKQQIDQVEIKYTNSSSKDLVSSILQRKYNDVPWQNIAHTNEQGSTMFFIDSTMNCQEIYYYRILAEDDVGLKSISDTLQLQCIDSGKRPMIDNVMIKANKDEKSIYINWDYIHEIPAKSIMIYRSKENGKMQKIKQFWSRDIDNSTKYSYLDKDLISDKRYSYYIIMRFEDNGFAKSKITDEIRL